MTEEGGSPSHQDSISVTDSATQVDLSPLRLPQVRDAQVSPFKLKKRPALNSSSHQEKSFNSSGVQAQTKWCHRRTRSEGDSLFYKKKAEDAFKRVRKISKQLREISLSREAVGHSLPESSASEDDREDKAPPEAMKQHCGVASRTETVTSSSRRRDHGSSGRHKCAWQEKVKALQMKLRTLSKQVCIHSVWAKGAFVMLQNLAIM